MFLSLTLKYLAARKLLQNILHLLCTLKHALQIHAKKTDILHFVGEKNAGNLNSPTDVKILPIPKSGTTKKLTKN